MEKKNVSLRQQISESGGKAPNDEQLEKQVLQQEAKMALMSNAILDKEL